MGKHSQPQAGRRQGTPARGGTGSDTHAMHLPAQCATLSPKSYGESGAMAPIDSPLKRLVSAFITDFAAWLLQADVQEAHPLNVELPTETLTVDQVFHITLADGRALLLHIEFQGRRSHAPMPWRMLE